MLLDKITNIVQDYSDDAIVKNPAIPNEKNDLAIKETASSLMNQLAGTASEGKGNLLDLFKDDNDLHSNPTVHKITNGVAGDLTKKLGISGSAASDIVSKIIPVILAKLRSKTNDPNDKDFDIGDILSSLTKGRGGIMGTIKNIFGH